MPIAYDEVIWSTCQIRVTLDYEHPLHLLGLTLYTFSPSICKLQFFEMSKNWGLVTLYVHNQSTPNSYQFHLIHSYIPHCLICVLMLNGNIFKKWVLTTWNSVLKWGCLWRWYVPWGIHLHRTWTETIYLYGSLTASMK